MEYYNLISTVERSYRLFTDIINHELDKMSIRDLNSTQGLILYNIGEQVMTVGELSARGMYQGSNVSYNIKKLIGSGYLEQSPSPHDRRSICIRLSGKGLKTFHALDACLKKQEESFRNTFRSDRALNALYENVKNFEGFLVQYAARQ